MVDQISVALATATAKSAAKPAGLFIKEFGLDLYNSITASFQSCFQGHVSATYKRCSRMKNILYRDQSVDLLSQYVHNNFTDHNNHIVSDSQSVSKLISGDRLLICGTAGAGKTMFMRWSALTLIDGMKNTGRIPLFLELRYFEDVFLQSSLEEYIYSKTSSLDESSTFGQFKEGLKSGLFIVLLDAVDEVNPNSRDKIVSKIMDFVEMYPKCGLVLSSRFDEKLESIQELTVLRTMPMDQLQIIEVISKLEYDSEVKKKLIDRLNEGTYEELKEFLSNPLLATIMLLTFDHSADIPTKLTAFYQQAFEALYQRHDAAKGAYKRTHYAALPIDRFQSIFSAFCFQTYLEYKFEFSELDLSSAFSSACAYCQEQIDPTLLIRDCMESVCLIQREGLENVFSHRSFQEYFCAFFISRYREENVGELIQAVASMENRSAVLQMLFEMTPEVFEYEWVTPVLDSYLSTFNRTRFNTRTGLSKAMLSFCTSFTVSLKSGRIVSFSQQYKSDKSQYNLVCHWSRSIYGATKTRLKIIPLLFGFQLWDDGEQFFQDLITNGIPYEIRYDDKHVSPQSEYDLLIEVTHLDADWLVHSRLPDFFTEVRSMIRHYRDDIMLRRDNRQAAVEGLLARPRPRSVN